MSRTVLLNPGPVNITDKVRQAMTLPDLCHREKEFSNLMAAIRAKLLQAFNIEETFTKEKLNIQFIYCIYKGFSMM